MTIKTDATYFSFIGPPQDREHQDLSTKLFQHV
jgi:hypothetical protein